MAETELDLRKLTFFTEGNTFTGSRTKDTGALLRYLVRPDKKAGTLSVFCWTADLCFEKAPDIREAAFPLDEDGLGQVQVWLLEQYQNL